MFLARSLIFDFMAQVISQPSGLPDWLDTQGVLRYRYVLKRLRTDGFFRADRRGGSHRKLVHAKTGITLIIVPDKNGDIKEYHKKHIAEKYREIGLRNKK